jgi:hypothetical protein
MLIISTRASKFRIVFDQIFGSQQLDDDNHRHRDQDGEHHKGKRVQNAK